MPRPQEKMTPSLETTREKILEEEPRLEKHPEVSRIEKEDVRYVLDTNDESKWDIPSYIKDSDIPAHTTNELWKRVWETKEERLRN